jgi:hypothetical protein
VVGLRLVSSAKGSRQGTCGSPSRRSPPPSTSRSSYYALAAGRRGLPPGFTPPRSIRGGAGRRRADPGPAVRRHIRPVRPTTDFAADAGRFATGDRHGGRMAPSGHPAGVLAAADGTVIAVHEGAFRLGDASELRESEHGVRAHRPVGPDAEPASSHDQDPTWRSVVDTIPTSRRPSLPGAPSNPARRAASSRLTPSMPSWLSTPGPSTAPPSWPRPVDLAQGPALERATRAIGELGFGCRGREHGGPREHRRRPQRGRARSARYLWPVLGLPPCWYKSAYRPVPQGAAVLSSSAPSCPTPSRSGYGLERRAATWSCPAA